MTSELRRPGSTTFPPLAGTIVDPAVVIPATTQDERVFTIKTSEDTLLHVSFKGKFATYKNLTKLLKAGQYVSIKPTPAYPVSPIGSASENATGGAAHQYRFEHGVWMAVQKDGELGDFKLFAHSKGQDKTSSDQASKPEAVAPLKTLAAGRLYHYKGFSSLGNRYLPASMLRVKAKVNLIGVVASIRTNGESTANNQWLFQGRLTDPTGDVMLRLFNYQQCGCPSGVQVGDVLLLRVVKNSDPNAAVPYVLGYSNDPWVFATLNIKTKSNGLVPIWQIGPNCEINHEEQAQMKAMWNWWHGLHQEPDDAQGLAKMSDLAPRSQPFSLIVQILNVEQQANGQGYLTVTDYTPNGMLHNNTDLTNGPLGNRMLRVICAPELVPAALACESSWESYATLSGLKISLPEEAPFYLQGTLDPRVTETAGISRLDKEDAALAPLFALRAKRDSVDSATSMYQEPMRESSEPLVHPSERARRLSIDSIVRPHLTLSDLEPNVYFDATVQIIREVPDSDGERFINRTVLLVTDYTENPLLPANNTYPQDGPLGSRSMRLFCHYHQSEAARGYLDMLNHPPNTGGDPYWPTVRVVNAKSAIGADGHLVAHLRDEKKDQSKIFLRKTSLENPEVQKLLKRERTDREEMKTWAETPPSSQEPVTVCDHAHLPISKLHDVDKTLPVNAIYRVRVRLRDVRPAWASDCIVRYCLYCAKEQKLSAFQGTPLCSFCDKKGVRPIWKILLMFEDASFEPPELTLDNLAVAFLAGQPANEMLGPPPSGLDAIKQALGRLLEIKETSKGVRDAPAFDAAIKVALVGNERMCKVVDTRFQPTEKLAI